MRQHAAHRARRQKLVCDPAEDPFAQAAAPIAAGHDQVCMLGMNQFKQLGCYRAARTPPDLVRDDDTMALQIAPDIGKVCLVLGFRRLFTNLDHKDLPGLQQKGQRVTHRAAALPRILACDDGAAKMQRSYDIGHHQDRPPRPQQDDARFDKVMRGPPSVPGPDNNEIRGPCLSGNEVKWQFEGGAPLDLLEMLALSAELPAHVIETCCHCPTVLLRRLAIDGDASRSENRPQGQARDANECRLEAVGEIKRELDSLLSQSRSRSRWTIIAANDIACSLLLRTGASFSRASSRHHDPNQNDRRALPKLRVRFLNAPGSI